MCDDLNERSEDWLQAHVVGEKIIFSIKVDTHKKKVPIKLADQKRKIVRNLEKENN